MSKETGYTGSLQLGLDLDISKILDVAPDQKPKPDYSYLLEKHIEKLDRQVYMYKHMENVRIQMEALEKEIQGEKAEVECYKLITR